MGVLLVLSSFAVTILEAHGGQLFWKATQTHSGEGETGCYCIKPTEMGGCLSSQYNSAHAD